MLECPRTLIIFFLSALIVLVISFDLIALNVIYMSMTPAFLSPMCAFSVNLHLETLAASLVSPCGHLIVIPSLLYPRLTF